MPGMLRRISWQTFRKWQWFSEVEPFDRSIYQLALIASILVNSRRDVKKRAEPYPLMDFVLNFDQGESKPEPKQTPEYMEMVLLAWMDGHNAILKERGQL